jgi:hypothetical protein
VAVVELVLGLVAGDLDLVDVGDDDEVAGVDVRSLAGFVLAAQPQRDLRGEPSQHLVGGVDDVPVVDDILCSGGKGFHDHSLVGSAEPGVPIRVFVLALLQPIAARATAQQSPSL